MSGVLWKSTIKFCYTTSIYNVSFSQRRGRSCGEGHTRACMYVLYVRVPRSRRLRRECKAGEATNYLKHYKQDLHKSFLYISARTKWQKPKANESTKPYRYLWYICGPGSPWHWVEEKPLSRNLVIALFRSPAMHTQQHLTTHILARFGMPRPLLLSTLSRRTSFCHYFLFSSCCLQELGTSRNFPLWSLKLPTTGELCTCVNLWERFSETGWSLS